jgi:hypothetical protein
MEPPKFKDAPGLSLKPMKVGWQARWRARRDLIALPAVGGQLCTISRASRIHAFELGQHQRRKFQIRLRELFTDARGKHRDANASTVGNRTMRIVGMRAYLKARWDRDHWPQPGVFFRRSQPSLKPRKKMDWLIRPNTTLRPLSFDGSIAIGIRGAVRSFVPTRNWPKPLSTFGSRYTRG